MSFNESSTVEAFIRDRLAGSADPAAVAPGLGWPFVGSADLPRQSQEALVEPHLRDEIHGADYCNATLKLADERVS